MSPKRREPVSGKVPIPGRWALRAACRGKPTNWWYPDSTVAKVCTTWARDVCRDCPVSGPCRDHALRYSEVGIWAGTTEGERNARRRRIA